MVTAVRFSNGQEAFPLITAAQNIPVFLRKSPLLKEHFFEWLKTENFSTACGTVTLKSAPSRGSDAPHVHPRPRKRPPRCTLDCGFKTPESPALRGFGGRAAGACDCGPLSCTKIERPSLPEKPSCKVRLFVQKRSRKYRQKVTATMLCCSKPLLIPFFNFSHKWPTFAFTPESGYTLAFAQRIAHNGSHGETGGHFRWGRYYYPRSVPHVSETLRGRGLKRRTLPLLGLGRVCSRRTQRAFGAAMRLCASLFRGVAAPLGCVILVRMLIALLGGSVANFPALWYDKFNKLESVMH